MLFIALLVGASSAHKIGILTRSQPKIDGGREPGRSSTRFFSFRVGTGSETSRDKDLQTVSGDPGAWSSKSSFPDFFERVQI